MTAPLPALQDVLLLLLTLPLYLVNCIPVDNGVRSDVEIACGHNGIVFSVATINPFEGHVYVKGRYREPGCRDDRGGRSTAGIELPFTDCGVTRIRSLNPKGVYVSTTVVVSFHPVFVTKVDRAYTIQCFYMEADKTVATDIEVSMLTTEFETTNILMPQCRYEILSNAGPDAVPVKYALIGQSVYHKWTCDSQTVDTFCLRVYSCFVNDLSGTDRVELLDEAGCALDKYLLNNLEYPTNLMAGVESHVFKYADRPQLYFQCQIELLVKEPGEPCATPQCPPLRRKRDTLGADEPQAVVGTLDVASPILETLELLQPQAGSNATALVQASNAHYWQRRTPHITLEHAVCLSPAGLSGLVTCGALAVIVSLVLAVALAARHRSPDSKPLA